jgi:hypothetical protein
MGAEDAATTITMRPSVQTALLSLALLFLTGCNATNRTQYVLSPAEPGNGVRAKISTADAAAVKAFLKPLAARMKLLDVTETSPAENLIVLYQQPGVESPLKLFAWTRADSIIVDLLQTPGSTGETLAYQRAKQALTTDLTLAFPGRVQVVPFPTVLQPENAPPR